MHAVEFLKAADPDIPGIVALFGTQRHFKSQVLAKLRAVVIGDDETSLTRFTGKEVDLQTVADELRTVSMWGDRRLVVVEEADDFVSKHRAGLEKYAEAPAKKSVLVLDVATWQKTTRLAKQLAKTGLDVEASPLKGAELSRWLHARAADGYDVKLDRDAAGLLIELIGDEPGLLDTELAKLSTFVGDRKRIALEDVRGMVGGWRTETTWAMTDAVREDRLADGLEALGQLLEDGEAPQKLLGGIGFVFRKLALATDMARKTPLPQALRDAGVFPGDLSRAEAYLRRIGGAKAKRIIQALVTTDAGLKGLSPLDERIQLERLLVELSGLG
jgi:DNA polymerase-3 subunit delta